MRSREREREWERKGGRAKERNCRISLEVAFELQIFIVRRFSMKTFEQIIKTMILWLNILNAGERAQLHSQYCFENFDQNLMHTKLLSCRRLCVIYLSCHIECVCRVRCQVLSRWNEDIITIVGEFCNLLII